MLSIGETGMVRFQAVNCVKYAVPTSNKYLQAILPENPMTNEWSNCTCRPLTTGHHFLIQPWKGMPSAFVLCQAS